MFFVPLHFTQSSDSKTFCAHFFDEVILALLLVISEQRALSTSLPTAITTFRVIAAPGLRILLRINFISSDTTGSLPIFFIEEKLEIFPFLK